MFKRVAIFLVSLGLLLVNTTKVLADPIDETTTNLVINSNKVDTEVYISWNQALVLVNKNDVKTPDFKIFENNKSIFFDFVKNNLSLSSNDSICQMENLELPQVTNDELMFGLGIKVTGNFLCKNQINDFLLQNKLFLNIPTQTNIVNIYEKDKSNFIQGTILTSKSQSIYFNGQDSSGGKPIQKNNLLTSKLTSKLKDSSPILILLIIFVLGFLHTLEAGHSKTILSSLVINKKISKRQTYIYSLAFTLTHLADILIMGVIFLVINKFTDLYSKLPYLQIFALYSLFFISTYMFLKELAEIIQEKFFHHMHHDHEHGHGHHHETESSDFKQILLMGFITGIAPCLFGWSIFMLLISLKLIWIIIPAVLIFGLGILTALYLFTFILQKISLKITKGQSFIGLISPVISALILVIYSLNLILRL